MKTTILKKTIHTAILLAGLALAANAQTPAGGGGGGGKAMIEEKLGEYKTVTGAGDDQLAKIRTVLETEHQAKKGAQELPEAEKAARLKEIQKTARQDIRKILTPEQIAKYKAFKESKETAKSGDAAKSE